jgi:hypothetical protein
MGRLVQEVAVALDGANLLDDWPQKNTNTVFHVEFLGCNLRAKRCKRRIGRF